MRDGSARRPRSAREAGGLNRILGESIAEDERLAARSAAEAIDDVVPVGRALRAEIGGMGIRVGEPAGRAASP